MRHRLPTSSPPADLTCAKSEPQADGERARSTLRMGKHGAGLVVSSTTEHQALHRRTNTQDLPRMRLSGAPPSHCSPSGTNERQQEELTSIRGSTGGRMEGQVNGYRRDGRPTIDGGWHEFNHELRSPPQPVHQRRRSSLHRLRANCSGWPLHPGQPTSFWRARCHHLGGSSPTLAPRSKVAGA